MKMRCLSVYYCPLYFLSVMFYSFHHRSFFTFNVRIISKNLIILDVVTDGIAFLISFLEFSLLVYRTTTDFCVLLRWNFLQICIFAIVTSHYVASLEFLMYISDDLTHEYRVLLLPSQFGCLCFSYSSNGSSMVLNSSSESRHSFLVPDLKGEIPVFYHWAGPTNFILNQDHPIYLKNKLFALGNTFTGRLIPGMSL